MLTSSTERKLCSGDETPAGYNERTHTMNPTASACAAVLKTNSFQGVLVSGSREKRFSREATELISKFTQWLFENTWLRFSADQKVILRTTWTVYSDRSSITWSRDLQLRLFLRPRSSVSSDKEKTA